MYWELTSGPVWWLCGMGSLRTALLYHQPMVARSGKTTPKAPIFVL